MVPAATFELRIRRIISRPMLGGLDRQILQFDDVVSDSVEERAPSIVETP